MNATPLIHVAVALAAYYAFGLDAGLLACVWWIGREHTQAEYRWIESYGRGLRANMPWWGGFDPRVWNKLDPWLDMMLPALAVGLSEYFKNFK